MKLLKQFFGSSGPPSSSVHYTNQEGITTSTDCGASRVEQYWAALAESLEGEKYVLVMMKYA
jgi:hypothetical protein